MSEPFFESWDHPSSDERREALRRVHSGLVGSRAMDAIDEGIRIRLRMASRPPHPSSEDARVLADAVVRVMRLASSSHLRPPGSLAVARMLSFDVDIRSAAIMALRRDGSREAELVGPKGTSARVSACTAVPGSVSFLSSLDERDLSAMAAGDFASLSGEASAFTRVAAETLLVGGVDPLSVSVLHAAGGLDASDVGRIVRSGSRPSFDDVRLVIDRQASRDAQDASRIGEEASRREHPYASARIAKRRLRSILSGFDGIAEAEVRSASNGGVDSESLRQVRILLEGFGLADRIGDPGFEKALGRASSAGHRSSTGGAAAQIVYDVLVQEEARRMVEDAERGRVDGAARLDALSRRSAVVFVRVGDPLFTSTPRDLQDMRAVAGGDVDSASPSLAADQRALRARAFALGREDGPSAGVMSLAAIPRSSGRSPSAGAGDRVGSSPLRTAEEAARAYSRIASLSGGPSAPSVPDGWSGRRDLAIG